MQSEIPTLAPMPPSLQDTARVQIQRWIRSTGITQAAFGERIGRTQVWVSKYLKGEFDADIDTLQQMAQVFRHSIPQLLDFPSDPDEETVLTLYRALRPEVRRLTVELLREMGRGRGPKPRSPTRPRS